jgi:V/A-type H+-transporting ATPase subunit D
MKIKLTQGELKRQRDALRQYERYLPTLQLKKQQVQLEIVHQQSALKDRKNSLYKKK